MRALIIAVVLGAATLLAGAAPQRIVSTAPSVTETLFALGLGARVVGDTTFCNYPPAARRLPKIGTFLQPNLEMILSLRPDLVVVIKNPVRLKQRMEALGLRAVEVDQETIPAIYESIRQLGDVAGVPGAAAELTARLKGELDAIRRRNAGKPRKRVAFIVGRDPGSLEGLVAAGKSSYLNQLLAIAGGENVFADAATQYPRVSLEEMLARNPDVIIDMGDMAQTRGVTDAQKRAVVNLWKRYPSLRAVKDGRVFAVASDFFVVPGPRMVDAACAFERYLQGDPEP